MPVRSSPGSPITAIGGGTSEAPLRRRGRGSPARLDALEPSIRMDPLHGLPLFALHCGSSLQARAVPDFRGTSPRSPCPHLPASSTPGGTPLRVAEVSSRISTPKRRRTEPPLRRAGTRTARGFIAVRFEVEDGPGGSQRAREPPRGGARHQSRPRGRSSHDPSSGGRSAGAVVKSRLAGLGELLDQDAAEHLAERVAREVRHDAIGLGALGRG